MSQAVLVGGPPKPGLTVQAQEKSESEEEKQEDSTTIKGIPLEDSALAQADHQSESEEEKNEERNEQKEKEDQEREIQIANQRKREERNRKKQEKEADKDLNLNASESSCPEAPCSSLAFCCFSRSSYLRACRSFFCALSNAAYFFLTSITIRPMDPSLRNEVGKIIFVVVFVLRRQRIREVGRLTFLNLTH